MAMNRMAIVYVSGLLGLSACSFHTPMAPIETRTTSSDRANIQPQKIAPIYMVKPGDTLYSIAWQTRRDFRQLAKWNQIKPPYLIKYGQRIKLWRPADEPAQSSDEVLPPIVIEPEEDVIEQEALPEAPPAPGAPNAGSAVTDKSSAGKPVLGKVRHWQWPARGKHKRVVSRKRGIDGIAIFGNRGQSVKAAAAGEVVYQGSGILGLGKLIIVKHNETYLSAYAHNDKILVKEGQAIRQGQVIAKMGDSDTDRVNLYFEIRKNGEPINPLKVLH
ncbi:MAG: hypothetical protein DSZ33_03865 [Gammaproteobacteria bacterium]|nr:MAG: hypothetical protein DSZ33_03865 [Gammaproteobacteria bacterium]